MLDIKFLRENPDIVKQNIKNKFQDRKLPLVDEVIALDKESRATQQEADELRAKRKKISKNIGGLKFHIIRKLWKNLMELIWMQHVMWPETDFTI